MWWFSNFYHETWFLNFSAEEGIQATGVSRFLLLLIKQKQFLPYCPNFFHVDIVFFGIEYFSVKSFWVVPLSSSWSTSYFDFNYLSEWERFAAMLIILETQLFATLQFQNIVPLSTLPTHSSRLLISGFFVGTPFLFWTNPLSKFPDFVLQIF